MSTLLLSAIMIALGGYPSLSYPQAFTYATLFSLLFLVIGLCKTPLLESIEQVSRTAYGLFDNLVRILL